MVLQIEGQNPGSYRQLIVHQNPWFSCFICEGFVSRAKRPAFPVWTAMSWRGKGYLRSSRLRGRMNKHHGEHPYKAIHQVQIRTQLVLSRHYLSDDLNSGHGLKSLSMQISFWTGKIRVRKCILFTTSLNILQTSNFLLERRRKAPRHSEQRISVN